MYAPAIAQMGFKDAIATALARYTEINGRASRREYWFFALFVATASLATLGMDLGIWRSVDFTPCNALLAFLTIVPSLAVSVRRLHDIGRSGWWLLLIFLPLVGGVMLVYWTCLRGDRLPNAYGAPMG